MEFQCKSKTNVVKTQQVEHVFGDVAWTTTGADVDQLERAVGGAGVDGEKRKRKRGEKRKKRKKKKS